MPQYYCTQCGEPCEVEDGAVLPSSLERVPEGVNYYRPTCVGSDILDETGMKFVTCAQCGGAQCSACGMCDSCGAGP